MVQCQMILQQLKISKNGTYEWQHILYIPLTITLNRQKYFDQLFEHLASHFLSLFPSTRAAASLPPGSEHQLQTSLALDAADHPVWSFFASMAVPASLEQQSFLVAQLREKVLENVLSAHQGWVAESERSAKLRNVNIFLHALGLDSSQISL
jgi:DNA topoisomerase 2-associated protein PAT1